MKPFKTYFYDWLAWAFFLLIPVVMLWQSGTSLAEQGFASGGPMENAATFPRILAWIMIGLAALNGARILSGRLSPSSELTTTRTTRLALISTAIFVAYLMVLPQLGYHITTPVLLIVLLWLFGLSPVLALIGSLVMTLTVAVVFEGLLNVVLPVGMFGIAIF